MPDNLSEARRRLLGSSPSPTPQTAPPLSSPQSGGAVDEARRRLLPNYRPTPPALPSVASAPLASNQPPALAPSAQSGWQYPFAGDYPLTQQFGANPQMYSQFGNPGGVPMANIGVDFGVPANTQIRPVAPGTIDTVGWDPNGWGNYVRVKHDDGSVTQYSHLSDVGVKQGQAVGYGDWLGNSGATGYTWGGANGAPAPHLDFTYYPQGFNRDTAYYGATDPMGFFLDSASAPASARPATSPSSTPQQPTTQASPYVAAPQRTRSVTSALANAPTAQNRQIWQEGAPEWADWLYRFGAGTVDVIADLPKGIAETADRVGDALAGRPQQIDKATEQNPLFQAGDWLEEQIAPEASPFYNPQYDEQFSAKLAGGLGSTAGYVAPALASGGLGALANAGRIPALFGGIARAIPFVSGALSYSAQMTDEARQMGATPDQIIRAQNTGYLLGALEGILPDELFGGGVLTRRAGQWANRLAGTADIASAPWLRKLPAMALAGTAAVTEGGVTEAVQEFLQTIGENYSAQSYAGYDPERALTQGVVDAFTVGGASGAIITALSLMAGVKPQLQTERPVTAPEVTETPQATQATQTPVVPQQTAPVTPQAPTEPVMTPVAQAKPIAEPIRVANPNPSQLPLTEASAQQTTESPLPVADPTITPVDSTTNVADAPLDNTIESTDTVIQPPLTEEAANAVADSPLPAVNTVPQTEAQWQTLAQQRAPIQSALTQIAPKLNANPALMPLVTQLQEAASTEKVALDTRNPTLLQQSQAQAEEVVATIERLQSEPVPSPIQTYPIAADPRLAEAVQATHDLGGDYIFPDSIETLQAALSGNPTSDTNEAVLFQYTDTNGQPVQIIRQANGALIANSNGQVTELQSASPATIPTQAPPVAVFIDGNGNIVLGGSGNGRVLLSPTAPGYFDFIHNIYRNGLVIPLPGDARALVAWRGAIYRAVNIQLEELTQGLADMDAPQQLSARLHYHILNTVPAKVKGVEVMQANWLRKNHRADLLGFEGIANHAGAQAAINGPLTDTRKFDATVQRAIYQALRNPKNWSNKLASEWNTRLTEWMNQNGVPALPVPSESTDYGVEGSIGNRLATLNSRIETINSSTWNGTNSLNSFERDLITLAKQVAIDYNGQYLIQLRPINGKKFGAGGQLAVVEKPAITLVNAETRTAYAPASAPDAKTEVLATPRDAQAGSLSIAYGANPRNQYEMRYRIVNAPELIASNRPDGTVNPNYLTDLQERGRGKVASQDQINRMTTEFYPHELLFDFHVLDRGTPIIGSDMMVESGNGRTMAMQNVIRLRPQAYQEYRQLLTERVATFGLSESDLENIDYPVLVRERLTPVDRVAFAQEANALNKLGMSPWEVARRDSRLIPDNLIDRLDISETGDLFDELLLPKNAPVINAYIDTLSPNVRGEILNEKGDINRAGIDRLIAAMTARIYNSEAGYGLIKSEFETPFDGSKNLMGALFDSFSDVAIVERMVELGQLDESYSIHEDIAQALYTLLMIRTATGSMRQVEGYIAMSRRASNLFEAIDPTYANLNPFQLDVMEFFVQNFRSRPKMDNVLKEWARGIVRGAPNQQQTSMFGMFADLADDAQDESNALDAIPLVTKEQAFYAAQEKVTGKAAPTTTPPTDNVAGRGIGVQPDAIGTELETDPIGEMGDSRISDTEQESVRDGSATIAETGGTEGEPVAQEESLSATPALSAVEQAIGVINEVATQVTGSEPVVATLPVTLSKTAFNKVKTHIKNAGLQLDTIAGADGRIEAVMLWREAQQQPAPKVRRRVTLTQPPVPPAVVEIVQPAQVPSGIRALMENVIGTEETNRALEILRELGREMGNTSGMGPAFSGKVVTLGAELAGIVIRGMTRQFAAYSDIVFTGLREQGVAITQPVKSAVAGWYAATRTNFLVDNNPMASEMDDDATVLRILRQLPEDTQVSELVTETSPLEMAKETETVAPKPKASKKGKAQNVEVLQVGKSALNRYTPNLNAIFANVENVGELVYGVGNRSIFATPETSTRGRILEKSYQVAWLWDAKTQRALMVPFDEQGIHFEAMEYYDTEGQAEAWDNTSDFFRTFQKKVLPEDVQLAWQQQQSFFADPDERYMLGGLVDKAFNFIAGTKAVPAQIAENAYSELWGDTLYVNNEAMLLIMAARGRENTARGVSYRDVDVQTIVQLIRELRVPKSAQPRVDALVQGLQRAVELTLPGEGVAIVNIGLPDANDDLIQKTRAHEWFHVGQQVLNYQGQHLTQPVMEILTQWQSPTSNWHNIALQLRAKGYPADTRILIEEASAFIAAGQWAELGLSREDAKAFLLQYMRGLQYEYGPDAVSVFNYMTDFAQEVREYANQFRTTSETTGSLYERRGSRIQPVVRPDVSGIRERYATEPIRNRRTRTSAERVVPDFNRWFNGSVVVQNGQPIELYATVQADGTRVYGPTVVADTQPSYLAIRNPLQGNAVMSTDQIDRALTYLQLVYGNNPITLETYTNTVANAEALRVAGEVNGQAFLNALVPTIGRTGAIRLVRGLGYDGLNLNDSWIPFGPEQVRIAERATPAPAPVVQKATLVTQQAAKENTKKGWSMSRMANSAFRALHIANTVTTASSLGLLGASSFAIVGAIQQDQQLAEALLQMAFNELSAALDSDEWESLTGAWWDDPFWNTLELMGWADRGVQYLYGLTLILNGQNNPNSTDWVTQQASRYSTLSGTEQEAFRKVLYLGFSGDAAMQNAYNGLLQAQQTKGSALTQLEAAQVLADHTDWVMSFVGETLFSPWNWIGSGAILGSRGIKGTQELRAANEILNTRTIASAQEAIRRAQAAVTSGDGKALLNIMNMAGRDGWALTPESKAAWAAHDAMMDVHSHLAGARDETDLWRRLAVWLNPTSDGVRLGQRFLKPRDLSDLNMSTVQKAVERWASDPRTFNAADYPTRLLLLKAATERYVADLVKDTVSSLYKGSQASQTVSRIEKISAFQKRALNNLLLRANLGFQATNFMGNVSTQVVDGVLGVGSKNGIRQFWQDTVGAMPEFIREGYSKLGIEASDNVETLASMQVYTAIYQHWFPELWNRGLQALRTPANAITRTQSDELIRVLRNAWDEGSVRTEIRRWATRNGIANAGSMVREAVEIQRRTANAALAAAHEARGFTLIHYWKKYGWDSALSLLFPYHHWVTRSMMNWTVRLADSPAAFGFYSRYSLAMRDGVNRNEQDPDYLRRNWSFANAGQVRTVTRAVHNITGGIVPSDLFTVGMEDDERLYLNVIDKILPLEQVYGLLPNVGFKRDLPEGASPISQIVDTLAQYPAALTPALGIALAAYRNANGEGSVDPELLDNLVSLPLYGARPLQSLTAAVGIGGPEGINLDAPYRRMMGLPANQEYELVRARKFVVDAVQQGLIGENDGFNAIATMQGPVWDEALRQSTRFYGDRGLVSAFTGFLPRTEPQDEQAEWRKGLTEVEETYGTDSPQAKAYRQANPGADVGRISTRNTTINRTLSDESGSPFTLYSATEAANRRLVNNLSPYSRNAIAPYSDRQVGTQAQYATWAQEAYRLLQTPQEKARIQLQAEMYRDRAMLFPNFAVAQEEYFDLPDDQKKAYLKAHPELQAGWDFETEFKKRNLDLFPLTEQERVEDTRPSIGLVLAAVNSGLDQDIIKSMGASQISEHLDNYYRDLDALKAQYPDLDGLYTLKNQAEATRTTREFYRSAQGQRLQNYWDAQSRLKDSYNQRYQQTGLPVGLTGNAPALPASNSDNRSEARRRLLGR